METLRQHFDNAIVPPVAQFNVKYNRDFSVWASSSFQKFLDMKAFSALHSCHFTHLMSTQRLQLTFKHTKTIYLAVDGNIYNRHNPHRPFANLDLPLPKFVFGDTYNPAIVMVYDFKSETIKSNRFQLQMNQLFVASDHAPRTYNYPLEMSPDELANFTIEYHKPTHYRFA